MIPMIMASNKRPVISYSCLIVTITLSDVVMEILMFLMFQGQGRFGHFRFS